jgi:hypothetical protein
MFTNPQGLNDFYNYPLNHTNPGAGANFSYTVPDRTSLELISLDFNFTADANVANRYLIVSVTYSGWTLFRSRGSVAYTAGTSNDISVGAGFCPPASGGSSLANQLSWPVGLVAPPNAIYSIAFLNIQAGDQISLVRTLFHRRLTPAQIA